MKNKLMTSLHILNKARTNILQPNDRKRHTNEEINCMVCDKDEKEEIYHFMLHCTQRREESQYIPYIEND